MTDLGVSDEGFRRRLHAAREARVVPWPATIAGPLFEALVEPLPPLTLVNDGLFVQNADH